MDDESPVLAQQYPLLRTKSNTIGKDVVLVESKSRLVLRFFSIGGVLLLLELTLLAVVVPVFRLIEDREIECGQGGWKALGPQTEEGGNALAPKEPELLEPEEDVEPAELDLDLDLLEGQGGIHIFGVPGERLVIVEDGY